jgi:hypothetical protein
LDENSFRPCNKKLTIQTLKQELIYSRSYIKIDVLEKILKTFNSDNSFFIIVCEKYIKVISVEEKRELINSINLNEISHKLNNIHFAKIMKTLGIYNNQNNINV